MHRYLYRAVTALMVVMLLLPIAATSAAGPRDETLSAQVTPMPPRPTGLTVSQPLHYSLSPALRDLARVTPLPRKPEPPREIPLMRLPKATKGSSRGRLGALLQNWVGSANMPSVLVSFEGNSNQDNQNVIGGMIQPPDTQGEVGPNHYVQWVNVVYSIYDKSGNRLLGPLAGNTLWASNPAFAACDTSNDGDIITLYDPLADRWLMSQFALPNHPSGPFYQCIAVSQTGDPTGAWYLYEYQIPVNKMNDYPKFGVWPDAYYMTVNQFNAGTMSWGGAGVAAFERSQMLAGNPTARMVYIDVGAVTLDYGGMLPADLDGPPLGHSVPAGTPGLFVEWDDSTWLGDPDDTLRVWEFQVDWANPANSTFGINANYDPNYQIPTLDVDPDMCGYNRNCIPQRGTTRRLDAISDRLMYRLQYRNFGSYQTLASNHTVDVDGSDHAGIHWFILRNDGSGWVMDQEGVYAPDSHHRWMGSFALDHVGNAALGYSISSSTVYPGIRYDGRLATDPAGTLPQGEAVLINGTGSQTGWSSRWGDYSMMSVDPTDDCTFWYSQEYYAVDGSAWQTRIGSFKFPNCVAGATGTLTGQVYDDTTLNGIGGASVQAASSPTQTVGTTTNSSGYYTLTLPAGTYT
ncbi:MAG: carboxypeptidase-like regulatory domain-containing protein, partial [Anaerolineae bacterium]|nr:carboxypeptidase-like regulatory domain-containing protein [Anaerolineae bacterium]